MRSPTPTPSNASPATVSGIKLRPVSGRLPVVALVGVVVVVVRRDGAVGVIWEDPGPDANACAGAAAAITRAMMGVASRMDVTGRVTLVQGRNQDLTGELLRF